MNATKKRYRAGENDSDATRGRDPASGSGVRRPVGPGSVNAAGGGSAPDMAGTELAGAPALFDPGPGRPLQDGEFRLCPPFSAVSPRERV